MVAWIRTTHIHAFLKMSTKPVTPLPQKWKLLQKYRPEWDEAHPRLDNVSGDSYKGNCKPCWWSFSVMWHQTAFSRIFFLVVHLQKMPVTSVMVWLICLGGWLFKVERMIIYLVKRDISQYKYYIWQFKEQIIVIGKQLLYKSSFKKIIFYHIFM